MRTCTAQAAPFLRRLHAAQRARTCAAAAAQHTRRALLQSASLLAAGRVLAEAPLVGDCADCIGVVNGSLAACAFSSASCVSPLNDDESHFVQPWVRPEGLSRQEAADELVRVACGGEYDGGWSSAPFGRDRAAVSSFILSATAAFLTRSPLPPKPPPIRAGEDEKPRFTARLLERSDESGYVRLLFEGQAATYDAEFLFIPDDEVVLLRVASRSQSGEGEEQRVELSLTDGLVVTRNGARVLAEALRQALHWELLPVVNSFDQPQELLPDRAYRGLRNVLRAARGEAPVEEALFPEEDRQR